MKKINEDTNEVRFNSLKDKETLLEKELAAYGSEIANATSFRETPVEFKPYRYEDLVRPRIIGNKKTSIMKTMLKKALKGNNFYLLPFDKLIENFESSEKTIKKMFNEPGFEKIWVNYLCRQAIMSSAGTYSPSGVIKEEDIKNLLWENVMCSEKPDLLPKQMKLVFEALCSKKVWWFLNSPEREKVYVKFRGFMDSLGDEPLFPQVSFDFTTRQGSWDVHEEFCMEVLKNTLFQIGRLKHVGNLHLVLELDKMVGDLWPEHVGDVNFKLPPSVEIMSQFTQKFIKMYGVEKPELLVQIKDFCQRVGIDEFNVMEVMRPINDFMLENHLKKNIKPLAKLPSPFKLNRF